MTTREQAIKWFNEKDTYNKSELSHKYYKETVSYNFTALTGREIEEIWRKETQTTEENIYLSRLKQEYRKYAVLNEDLVDLKNITSILTLICVYSVLTLNYYLLMR